MIRNHVAQRPCLFVISGASSHPHCFRRSDLDIVDIVAVPDRLEHRVTETKHKNVLHGVFAEVMIDTINLVFLERARDHIVQRQGRIVIAAEWFFYDDTRPATVLFRQTCLP